MVNMLKLPISVGLYSSYELEEYVNKPNICFNLPLFSRRLNNCWNAREPYATQVKSIQLNHNLSKLYPLVTKFENAKEMQHLQT